MAIGMNDKVAGRALRLGAGLGVALLLGSLGGCATSSGTSESLETRPPVAAQRPAVTVGQYRVRPGDTLYSIATRHGWDWRELAARNGIPAPFTIRVGQVIRFAANAPAATAPAVVATAARPLASSPSSTAVSTSTSVTASASAAAVAPQAMPSSVTPPVVSSSGWAWPAGGQLIALFSSNSSLNKGIDIAGELGQPVMAASAGSVVYAGSGLRGYGELVIIKHSDTYVSAYGHNRRLLVREGQQVKAGQTIAEMGATGTDRVKLHFEIRRQGKPVDPLQYLPRR